MTLKNTTGAEAGSGARGRVPESDVSSYGSGGRLQVPMTEKGFPPLKLTVPESLHLGFEPLGAVVLRNRVVTPLLSPSPPGQVRPSEWRKRSSLAPGAIVASNRDGRSRRIVVEAQASRVVVAASRPGALGPAGGRADAGRDPQGEDVSRGERRWREGVPGDDGLLGPRRVPRQARDAALQPRGHRRAGS